MQKAINHQGQLTSIAARVDGSIGYRIITPELNSEQKSAIFDLQNKNVEVLITPQDVKEPEMVKVNTDLNQKTPSQRQRSILFLLWKADPKDMTFEEFYNYRMEQIIEQLKERLDQ